MAIIYNVFWNKLIESNAKVSDYLYKQKEEELNIEFGDEENNENPAAPKKNSSKNKDNNGTIKNQISSQNKNYNNSTTNSNTNSFESDTSQSQSKNNSDKKKKKKERRANPYSQMGDEEEVKLNEDATLLKGITFNSFEILECLGSGTFGKVFKVKLKDTEKIYAMKIINKKFLIKNQQLRYAVTECNVLKQAKHPFIITLHYAFQTPDHLYMILDYCPGGDFSYHIVKNLFEEDEAKFFVAELVLAIEHLHNLDIIYRDLKPENILIDAEGHIRLADFGLAKENVSDNKIAQSFCGSPAYLAPEMVNRRGVGKAADIYGVGAVLYEMISGTPPFYAHDLSTMYKNISTNNLMFPDYFSEELKDLLKVRNC
jgi:tRNA A-37 threonylcarbamoyl transferase component Bud32